LCCGCQVEEGKTSVQQLQEVAASKDGAVQELTAKLSLAEQAVKTLERQV